MQEQQQETGTALEGVGSLPSQARALIEYRRQMNQVAAKLAESNWGSTVDLPTRRVIAEWGRAHDVDVVREIDVLGGRLYLNAQYYLRRLADLVEAGVVEYAYADHVEEDPRLLRLIEQKDPWAMEEQIRRLQQRIVHHLPEEAKVAVIFRVKLRSMTQEVTGAKAAGGYRGKYQSGKDKDPVGEEFSVETCESRAARRCLRQLISISPQGNDDVLRVVATVESTEAGLGAMSEVLKDNREHQRVLTASTVLGSKRGPTPVRHDGYESDGNIPADLDVDQEILERDQREEVPRGEER